MPHHPGGLYPSDDFRLLKTDPDHMTFAPRSIVPMRKIGTFICTNCGEPFRANLRAMRLDVTYIHGEIVNLNHRLDEFERQQRRILKRLQLNDA